MAVASSDLYTRLCEEFPPHQLQNAEELAQATAIVERLSERKDLWPGERQYLWNLKHCVEAAEMTPSKFRRW
jgi:hypothetical protein